MARLSNRDRIARAAEEARLAEAEKTAKKAVKKAPKARSKASATPQRVKIVWEICNVNGKPIKVFAYPDKAQAEAETLALTRSTGKLHAIRATKVPMED